MDKITVLLTSVLYFLRWYQAVPFGYSVSVTGYFILCLGYGFLQVRISLAKALKPSLADHVAFI